MAFSNLFTKLRDVEEKLEDPNRRNNTNGQEGSSKRKPQTTQSGHYMKRQCLQPYAAGTSNSVQNEENTTYEAHRFNRTRFNNNPRSGVSRNQRNFSNYDNNRGNTSNATTQKKKDMKNKWKKKRKGESGNGRRKWVENQQNRNHKQPRQQFMSQEFKEQNSLEVDGHVLCIHFIRGRCIKGEECQFEHIEGYNGLIKEACKFYVQGYCLKGKSCPYLHETFPCKYFHTKAYCGRDPCRFSHDPLTDFTTKLLNDLIQWENELKNKAEKAALSQSENVCEAVEENTTIDFVIPTARPRFYHNSESPVDEDTLIPEVEQTADITEDDNALQTENNLQPEESLPSASDQPGPVCYSVEAMLGPKLFKPCLYTAPKHQEEPLYDSKTTDNSSSNLINAPVANVLNTKSATTSNLLPTPSIAPSIVASCQSKHKERILIFNDKYSVSPSVKEKMFKKPSSCQDFATSGYHDKQYKKPDLKLAFCGAKMECDPFNAKGELRVGSNAPNSMLKGKNVATDCNRQYITLMGSNCPSQIQISSHIQKDKFDERGSNQSYFKDKPPLSLKNDKSLSNTSFKKAMTPIQQSLKETNSETSLNAQSSCITNVEENRQENVASPCTKTTSRLNSLFASFTPDVDPTSAVRNSVSGTTTVQSVQRFESHCGNQMISSSKTKQKEIESDTSPPAKKFHALFASLTPDSDRTLTVSNGAGEKPTVQTSVKRGKSVCASKKNNCDSIRATQPSHFTENIPISTNSKTDYHSKKLVSTSFKCSNKEEDMESTKTLPAKSFQSLFASLTPDSDRTLTVINSVDHKPAVPSSQKVKNSICDHQKVNCDSSQTLKPNQCTGNTSESPNNSSYSNHMQVEASTETASNNSQGLVTSFARSKFKVTNKKNEIIAKTPHENSFQSLFASLTPDSDQTSTVGNNFSKNTAVPSDQKVEQSICTSEKISCGSNRATKPSQCPGNTLESTHNGSSNHSKRLVSATTNLKCSKEEEDTETAKSPPAKSFQSLFASLTPDSSQTSTVGYRFRAKPAAPSAQKDEKSICDNQKVEYDLNQTRSQKNEERTNESTIPTSCNNGKFGLVEASTETSSEDGQKFVSSATSDLKSTNNEEGIQSAETPLKSFQILFASLTPTVAKCDKPDVCVHNVEKSKCENDNSDSNQAKSAAKQNQLTENSSESTTNDSSSRYGDVGLVIESTKTKGQKLISSSATFNLKSKNKKDYTAPSAKLFQNLLEVDLTSKVQPQEVEKSIFHSPEVKCDASQATKQNQYSESTPKSNGSSSNAVAARTEALNNSQKPVSCATSKGENKRTESVKSFNNVFAALLGESSVTNDSKMPCSSDLPQCMAGKLSHERRSLGTNTENKQIEESKNEMRTKSATTNSPNVSNTAPANPQQKTNGPSNSTLRTLFQQLRPYEQQEHQVCVKGSIHPG